MKVAAKLATPEAPAGAVRVAFASKDRATVDEHFGWATDFSLYDVTADGFGKAGKIVFEGEELSEKGNDDKLAGKIDALAGCHMVYSVAIGGPAAARLTRAKIQPMVVKGTDGIEALCKELSGVLSGPMPPWLRKIAAPADPGRFDAYDDEDDE